MYLSVKLFHKYHPFPFYYRTFPKLNLITMNLVKVVFLFLYATHVSAQCNSCQEVNYNGDFEIRNNTLGNENANGILQGEIPNWYNTHGSGDFFDPLWNWYYITGIQSNMGHLCYGSRPSHDHSEGMFTSVDILGDDDLSYCVQFDYGSYCDSDKYGKAHVYLANNLQEGSINNFMLPEMATHSDWFARSKNIDVIELDEETSFAEVGMTTYTTTFTPDQSYGQLWFYTEYSHNDDGFVNCGLMLDNVKISCTTTALAEIIVNELEDDKVELVPVFTKSLQGVTYEWTYGTQTSNKEKIIISKTDKSQDICLKIKDKRGACAEACVTVRSKNGAAGQSLCDYAVCLDAGGGIPTIESVQVEIPGGQVITIDKSDPLFSFPYCIGAFNMCSSGAYELEHLVADLNLWMLDNDYEGQVTKTENSGYIENCRANKIITYQSEVSFLSLTLGNEKSNDLIVVDFEQSHCNDVEQEEGHNHEEPSIAYPNPTVGAFIVEIPQGNTDSEVIVELRCIEGYIIDSHNVDANQVNKVEFDLSDRKSGIYYINVRSEHCMESHKIVKL